LNNLLAQQQMPWQVSHIEGQEDSSMTAFRVRVWDAPTRFFHWALVLCFVGSVSTAKIGGAAMAWHFRFGYCILTLLLFRLLWGFIGGHWSRFSSFIFHPRQVVAYLRGQGDALHGVGHNPLGAGSVFAMLGFLSLQVATGLMSDDEIAAAGPLSRHVSNALVHGASFYHKEIGQRVLLLLVFLHLCAIAFYFFRKHENLVRAMLSGDKTLSFCAPSADDGTAQRSKAVFIVLVCVALVGAWVTWLG